MSSAINLLEYLNNDYNKRIGSGDVVISAIDGIDICFTDANDRQVSGLNRDTARAAIEESDQTNVKLNDFCFSAIANLNVAPNKYGVTSQAYKMLRGKNDAFANLSEAEIIAFAEDIELEVFVRSSDGDPNNDRATFTLTKEFGRKFADGRIERFERTAVVDDETLILIGAVLADKQIEDYRIQEQGRDIRNDVGANMIDKASQTYEVIMSRMDDLLKGEDINNRTALSIGDAAAYEGALKRLNMVDSTEIGSPTGLPSNGQTPSCEGVCK